MAAVRTLFVYPSALARDAALDERCRASASGAAWADDFLTMARLLQMLALKLPQAGTPPQVLEGTARAALLARSWKAAGRTDEPTTTALEALGRLISAWKGAGAGPEVIEKAVVKLRQPHPRLAERLRFVASVYLAYEKELGKNWTDREGHEMDLLRRLQGKASQAALERGTRLVLVGFHRIVPLHRAVLERLRELGCVISVERAIPWPQEDRAGGVGIADGNHALVPFETVVRSFGRLREAALPEEAARTHSVRRVEAPTQYSEIYEIGRRVRRWIIDEGVAPERICVAFRDLGPYSQFLADVFRRLNIPYYERRGEPAAFQPLVRAAKTALDAVRRGLAREDLFRFLCSGLVDLPRFSGVPDAPAPWALHRLALDARIDRLFGEEARQPAEAWHRKLRAHAQALAMSPRRSREAKPAEKGAEILSAIVARMEKLREPRSRAQFVKDWSELWTDAGLLAGAAAGAPAGSEGARRLVESARALEQALHELTRGPDAREALTLDAFAALLETAIAAQSVRVDGRSRAGSVRILNLYDLRGLRFDRLVLAGMDESRFPAAPSPDPVLGMADGRSAAALRTELERLVLDFAPWAGVEPRLPAEVRDEERALLELARSAVAENGVWLLTRSRTTEGGRPVGASSYWDDPAFVCAQAEEVAPVRPAPSLRECETGEEAELRAAWVLGGGGDRSGVEEAALAAAGANAGRMPHLMERARVERVRERFFESIPREREQIEASEVPGELGTTAGAFDGKLPVAAPSGIAAALQRRMLENPLSPSALEKQAQCRFRYLAEYLYQVDALERPEDDLSPLSRGSLWHDILAKFYGELLDESRKAGRVVAVLQPSRRVALLNRLKELAEKACKDAPEQFFTGHPGLWGLQREKLLASLGVWLEFELQRAQEPNAFRPAFVEFAFGEGRDAPPVQVPLETSEGPRMLRLEGRIDRVDLLVADPAARVPVVRGIRLLDYKLGKGDRLKERLTPEEMRSLRQAQLPVYLAAAVGFLKEQEKTGWTVDWDEVRATSETTLYSLRDLPAAVFGKGSLSAFVKLKDEASAYLRGLVDPSGAPADLIEAVQRNVSAVLNGRFAVAPWECAGIQCTARFACRYRNLPVSGDEGGEDA